MFGKCFPLFAYVFEIECVGFLEYPLQCLSDTLCGGFRIGQVRQGVGKFPNGANPNLVPINVVIFENSIGEVCFVEGCVFKQSGVH